MWRLVPQVFGNPTYQDLTLPCDIKQPYVLCSAAEGTAYSLPTDEQYLKWARTLPVPTARQIALFSSYIVSAHSWYKHLAARRMVPFYFYLDLLIWHRPRHQLGADQKAISARHQLIPVSHFRDLHE